ncbi:hypothetical protein AB5I41_27645 [Sphingomonas sp. MMS24-JH45]
MSQLDFSFSRLRYHQADHRCLRCGRPVAQPYTNFSTDQNGFRYTQDVRYEGRYYGIGFRFRFGE